MDEVMKSLESSTPDSGDYDKPATSVAEISVQPVRTAQCQAETNGHAQASTVQLVAGSDQSPNDESDSDTESASSEETTGSESTVSADDARPTDDTVFTSHPQRMSYSPPVMLLTAKCAVELFYLLFVAQLTELIK